MKNFFLICNRIIFSTVLLSLPILESQDLKKEIHIPFPISPSLDESVIQNKKKKENIIQPEKKTVRDYINIPFPDDKVEKKNDPSANQELPLENLLVMPKMEITNSSDPDLKKIETVIFPDAKDIKNPIIKEENKVKPIIEKKPIIPVSETNEESKKDDAKIIKEIGKALTEQKKVDETVTIKPTDKTIPKKSNVIGIGKYSGKDELPTAESDAKKAPSKKVETKTAEVAANLIPVTNLPNTDKTKTKKGKDKKTVDESSSPFERSKYYLNRNDKPSAIPELNAASSSDGEKSNLAKIDQIRLLASERKKNEAKNIIDGLSPEFRFKGLYELAVGLENSAKSDKKLKEEAIPFHLTIITEATKTDSIVPKSLWALSHLLFTIGDHTPALDHLSEIILSHSNTEFADDAIYLSGRIYEESTTIRNLNRAKKYYTLFLENEKKKYFKHSIYLPFVKKRLELLEN